MTTAGDPRQHDVAPEGAPGDRTEPAALDRIASALERSAEALERFALNDNERMETSRQMNELFAGIVPQMAAMFKRFAADQGWDT